MLDTIMFSCQLNNILLANLLYLQVRYCNPQFDIYILESYNYILYKLHFGMHNNIKYIFISSYIFEFCCKFKNEISQKYGVEAHYS